MRWPARVEDVGVVVVRQWRGDDEGDGVDGKEDFTEH